ncbi:MAG: TonB family protein [Gemmatimonadales bacterium]
MVSRGGMVSVVVHLAVVALLVRVGRAAVVTPGPKVPIRMEQWPLAPLPRPTVPGGAGGLVPVAPIPTVPDLPRPILIDLGAPRAPTDPRRTVPIGEPGPAVPTTVGESVEPPVLIGAPALRFPEALRVARLSGRVTVEFIVDTAGRVEPGSVELIETTEPAFGPSALAAVAEERFRPGRQLGKAVRTRVRQVVAFDVH